MENETNITDEENGQEGYVLNTRRKLMLSLDIFIFFIGFFGNGSVIFITLRHKGLRTIPNFLITNLALGDLMMIIFVVFINILYPLLPAVHPYTYHYCEFFFFIQFWSLGVSVLTLTALSVDRYTTVAYPMHKQRIAKRLTIWTVIGIWLVSFIVVCPWFTLIDNTSCWFAENKSSAAYLISLVMILYILPTIIMVVCYFFTARRLMQRNESLNLDPRGGNKQQKKRSRLSVIVLIMTILFVLCSTLIYVWLITYYFAPNHRFATNMVLKEIKAILLKLNSIINPVILYLMSTTYRRYFMYHFLCIKLSSKRKNQSVMLTHATTNGNDLGKLNGRGGHFPIKNEMAVIKEEDSRI